MRYCCIYCRFAVVLVLYSLGWGIAEFFVAAWPTWLLYPIELIIAVIAGVVLNGYFLGFLTSQLVKRWGGVHSPFPKDVAATKLWETQIVGRGGGGEWIGPFECVIFFAALVMQRWEIAGAWMAFKVASKWESWKNVVAVPEYLPRADPLDYLLARKRYGTLGYVTFLVGTALNAVLASVGAFIAMYHQ